MLTAGFLSSPAPCQMYSPHVAQATHVASVNPDKRGSPAPFYERSPVNLSGSKIRQELLSPDVLLSEGLALCLPLPLAWRSRSPFLVMMRVLDLPQHQIETRSNAGVKIVFRSLNACMALSVLIRLTSLLNVFLSRKVIVSVETS